VSKRPETNRRQKSLFHHWLPIVQDEELDTAERSRSKKKPFGDHNLKVRSGHILEREQGLEISALDVRWARFTARAPFGPDAKIAQNQVLDCLRIVQRVKSIGLRVGSNIKGSLCSAQLRDLWDDNDAISGDCKGASAVEIGRGEPNSSGKW
jgi:hypothetical protein